MNDKNIKKFSELPPDAQRLVYSLSMQNQRALEAEIDAMSDEQVDASLKEAGIEIDCKKIYTKLQKIVNAHNEKFGAVETAKPFIAKKIEQIKQELRDFFTQGNAYCERIEPLAAADGNHKTAPKTFSCLHGYISLNHENIFNEEKYKRLRFKCREELIDELFGRSIQVTIGPTTYDLGKVNRRGMAQTDIPYDVDFQQTIDVRLVAKEG